MLLLSVLAIQGTGFIEPHWENIVFNLHTTGNSSENEEPWIYKSKREQKKWKIKNY
jgi:hypothetical protein